MSGSSQIPDVPAPANSLPEFWKRLAWTLGPVAAFCALSHVPLFGMDLRILGELLRQENDSQRGMLANTASTMGAVRSLSIGMLGLSYLQVCVGLVLLARSASARFEARLAVQGGWGGVMSWASRLTALVTVLVSWSILDFLAAPAKFQTALLIRNDGLLSYYLPNLAAILFATAAAFWLARVVSERGLGDGLLGLLAVQALFRLVAMVSTVPTMMRTGALGLEGLLLPGASIFLVVALTGLAILGSRRIRLYRSGSRSADDPWPHGLELRVAPAVVWPMLAAIALSEVLPETARYFNFGLAGWWLRGTGFTRLTVQLAIFAVLAPRAAAAAVDPGRIAAELQRRGARIPGVRPGERTAERIRAIQRRLTVAGAILLGAATMADFVAGYFWRRLFQASAGYSAGRWVLIAAAFWLSWSSARDALRRSDATTAS